MMRGSMRVFALLLAPLLAAATVDCAALRPVVIAPSDWEAYRRWRLASSHDERLRTAWNYLRDEQSGAYRLEVLRWFGPAEARFFEEAGRTPGGASAYLQLMPDGPHAEEERTFLRAFEREKIESKGREERELAEARRRTEVARKAVGEAIETWTRRALGVAAWGVPVETFLAVEAPFAQALAEAPKATCGPSSCSKTLYLRYPIPDASPAEDRVVPVVVRLVADSGAVTAIEIVAPKGGFTWWMEGAEARGLDEFDAVARGEAIARAKNRVELVVRDVKKTAACTTAEAPEERVVDCGAVRVVIVASPNGDDVVRVVGVP
jgi:hypothetical protein